MTTSCCRVANLTYTGWTLHPGWGKLSTAMCAPALDTKESRPSAIGLAIKQATVFGRTELTLYICLEKGGWTP